MGEQTFTMRLSEEDELSTAIALSLIDAKTAEAKQNQKLEEAREARKVAEKAERKAIEKFKLAQADAKVAKSEREKDELSKAIALSLVDAATDRKEKLKEAREAMKAAEKAQKRAIKKVEKERQRLKTVKQDPLAVAE